MHNNLFCPAPSEAANRTGFRGVYINASLEQLEKVLGQPTSIGSGDGKVNFQWVLHVIAEGAVRVVTVYDYKEEHCPRSSEMIKWHVGGNHDDAALALATEVERLIASLFPGAYEK